LTDQDSLADEGLLQIPASSGKATVPQAGAGRLRKELSSFGVLLLTLSCLSPVFSIYGVGSDVLQHAGTGAAGLFLLGIGAAVVWAVVYAELGSAYPYAGGDYVGVGSVLGRWAGVVTLAVWAVTAGPQIAFEAEVIADYVGELAPGIPPYVSVFGSLAASVLVALLAVRTSALVTGLFLAVEMIAVVVLIVAGFWHPARGIETVIAHPMAFGEDGLLVPASVAVLALGGLSAAYATVGGNQAIYFGEELGDPHQRMGRVILMAALIGAVATAVPIVAVVLGTQDLGATFRSPAPFATFMNAFGGPWAGKALSAGVALAIFNAVIAQVMAFGRLYFSLGRDALFTAKLNRFLSGVHVASGAPRAATLVVGVFSALCCFLSSHVLLIFITGLLVYAWALVCLAVLVGRIRGLTGQQGYWRSPLFPLGPVLGLVMAVIFTIADITDPDAGRPSLILLGIVVVAAVLWSELVLKRRPGGWTPVLGDTPSLAETARLATADA
jgi:amino acid transporter